MAENRRQGRSRLRMVDGLLLLGGAALAVIVAFTLLHAIVGLVWFGVKALVVAVVLGSMAWLLLHRRT